MRRRSGAIPIIKIARPACDALPDERCDTGRYPSGRPVSGLCRGRMEV